MVRLDSSVQVAKKILARRQEQAQLLQDQFFPEFVSMMEDMGVQNASASLLGPEYDVARFRAAKAPKYSLVDVTFPSGTATGDFHVVWRDFANGQPIEVFNVGRDDVMDTVESCIHATLMGD